MRVRHLDRLTRPPRRGGGRRPTPPVDPQDALADGPPETIPDERFHERRHRLAGGPEDAAEYACQCGYVFRAAVSASVACPHCGTEQAW